MFILSLNLFITTHSYNLHPIRLIGAFLYISKHQIEFQISWCSELFLQDMMRLDIDDRILLRGSRGLPNIHHVNDTTMVDFVFHAHDRFICRYVQNWFASLYQVISYSRGPFVFVFNFHPTNSYERYSIGVEEAGEYQVSDVPMIWTPKFPVKLMLELWLFKVRLCRIPAPLIDQCSAAGMLYLLSCLFAAKLDQSSGHISLLIHPCLHMSWVCSHIGSHHNSNSR